MSGDSPSLIPDARRDFVAEYSVRAPLALSLERALECRILAGRRFPTPILDLGCGDGTFAEVLFGRQRPIDHGLEPDPVEWRRARERGAHREVHLAAGDSIPLPDGSIGTVLSNSTIEHIPDMGPVLAEIHRVLRPGGIVRMTVPTDRFDRWSFLARFLASLGMAGLEHRFRRAYNAFWRHYHYLPAPGWARLLEGGGFEIQDIVSYAPPGRCTLHDLLVPWAVPAHFFRKSRGRYFLSPRLRRRSVGWLRSMLPRDAIGRCDRSTAGLVFLEASKRA